MPHCVAFECNVQAKNKQNDPKIRFHVFPRDKELRQAWIHAIGRTSLPKDPRLCSKHFEQHCFKESYLMELRLLGSSRMLNPLKPDAVPTLFSHRPAAPVRLSSVKRAEKRQKLETLAVLLEDNPGTSTYRDENQLALAEGQDDDLPEMLSESISQTMCDMGTQTECPSVTTLVSMVDNSTQCEMPTTVHSPTTCNAECQFPLDVCETDLADHTYCDKKAPQVEVGETVPDLDLLEEVEEMHAYNASQGSQLDLFPDLSEVEPNENADDEPMEVIISQETESSQSEYQPSGDQSASQGEAPSSEEEMVESSFGKRRVFLIYEENLKELLRFCPRCGAFIVPESIEEVQNEGTQLTLKLNCLNNCNFKWQSQPPLCDIKGAGNLLVSAGIFFCGIPFSKFQSFSRLINLKCIGQGTYYNLREKYVFPVVTTTWKEQQAEIFADLKSRETEAVLAGDGRCDSPGHCAKYCTYTLLDVESQKVVDFKVVVVSEVANSNCMEKKGFVDTLSNIEANGIKVGVISTDRHPQIKKELRVNHPNIDHQFDPWHVAKSVSKKLSAASKKSGCSELAPWIPSIVNHLWWSAESCGKDPEVLKERWLSVIHHVTNRHEWPGNRHFHKCEHGRLTTEEQRRKKWLKPGSTAHTALLNIVKDKHLLKDIVHLVECVHTTALEVYHSLYLKYLPKLTHFTYDVMKAGTMLAALDHNFNSNRPQALIQTGELQGEPRFKISWSKVSKRFGAEPVLEKKSYEYLDDMLQAAFHLAVSGTKPAPKVKDRSGVMAPAERPSRKEIIDTRQRLSRFK